MTENTLGQITTLEQKRMRSKVQRKGDGIHTLISQLTTLFPVRRPCSILGDKSRQIGFLHACTCKRITISHVHVKEVIINNIQKLTFMMFQSKNINECLFFTSVSQKLILIKRTDISLLSMTHLHTIPFKSNGVGQMFLTSLFCSTRLQLFDQKYKMKIL